MGILNQIKSALLKSNGQDAPTTQALAAIKRDGRLHIRLQVPKVLDGYVSLAEGAPRGQLVNLSYGGLAATFDNLSPALATNQEHILRLSLLDSSISSKARLLRIKPLDSQKTMAAFALIHDEARNLLFLRNHIEPLCEGGSLMLIPLEARKDRYRSPEWHCFRGDRSSDLIFLKTATENRVIELLLTFPWQEGYRQVLYQNGKISTGAVDGPGESTALGTPTVRSTAHPDPIIARAAICILASVPEPYGVLLAPLITQLIAIFAARS